MKRSKKIKLLAVMIGIMVSCFGLTGCTSGDIGPKPNELGNKYIDLITIYEDNINSTYVTYDKNTNVMYFMKWMGQQFGITPIYNTDGSLKLYQEETEQIPASDTATENVSEYVDSDTGVHYLIYSPNADGEKGGITPRLNPDGSIMVD